MQAHAMSQQLQNLASDDIIHGYRDMSASRIFFFFSDNGCLNGCNVSSAESQVEDC